MRVLVAGATGVLGRALLPLLREQGHQVVALLRDPGRIDGPVVDGPVVDGPVVDGVVVADALDAAAVCAAVGAAKPDVVVHQLTALRGLGGPGDAGVLERTARLRTQGTANLLAAARAAGVRRIVAQSISFSAQPAGGPVVDEDAPRYLDPPDPDWARTFQAVAELERLVAAADDVDGAVLRYGTLYGPGTAYDPRGGIGAALHRGRLPLAGDGAGVTSFVGVHDAALATALAVASDATGVYHITDDEPATAAEWLPAVARLFGGPAPRGLPPPMVQRMWGWFTVYQQTRMLGADNARAARVLGWRPTRPSWRQGLRP